jgi:hypothetical protein
VSFARRHELSIALHPYIILALHPLQVGLHLSRIVSVGVWWVKAW